MTLNDPLTIPARAVDAAVRSSRARVPLTRSPGLFGRLVSWYSRRAYGQVLDVALAMGHHRPVLMADMMFERRVASWNKLDQQLKFLAVLATALRIECGWCVDFGYYEADSRGLDLVKMAAVPRWRESAVFTDLERRVMEYAEAMTESPPAVTDQMADLLRAEIGVAALVELTMMVAVENLRSRFNASLGLASQGFSETCRVPAGPHRSAGATEHSQPAFDRED